MVTGSTTVGVITAASIAAPMMDTLGLSPERRCWPVGGFNGRDVNSSYFWVCMSLSRLKAALLSYGGVTFVHRDGGIRASAGMI